MNLVYVGGDANRDQKKWTSQGVSPGPEAGEELQQVIPCQENPQYTCGPPGYFGILGFILRVLLYAWRTLHILESHATLYVPGVLTEAVTIISACQFRPATICLMARVMPPYSQTLLSTPTRHHVRLAFLSTLLGTLRSRILDLVLTFFHFVSVNS